MKRTFDVFWREVRHVMAEHSLLLTLLLAPLLYAFIYGSIYLNKDERDVRVAVVDEDNSSVSRILINELNSSRMVETVLFSTVSEAKEAMYRGDVQGYLEIQNGLEARVFSLKQSNINLYINSAQFLPSSAVMMALNEVSLTVGAGIRKTYFEKQGTGSAAAMQMTNPIKFDYRPLFNEGKNYGTFLIPGLLAIILQQTLLIGLSAAIAEEREKNTLKKLLARNSLSEIIFGKGLFYWLVFMIYGMFFITVNFSLLSAAFRGNYLHLFILTGIFIGSIISLAMLVGSFFKTTLMAFQVMGFSSYPIFMITGYSLPTQALPTIIQWISYCLPTTPYLKAYSSIVFAGGTLTQNSGHLLHLVVLWLILIILLMLRLHYIKRVEKAKIAVN